MHLIVLGGLCLVAGLWAGRMVEARTVLWLASAALIGTGVVALALGIASEVTYGPLERF